MCAYEHNIPDSIKCISTRTGKANIGRDHENEYGHDMDSRQFMPVSTVIAFINRVNQAKHG